MKSIHLAGIATAAALTLSACGTSQPTAEESSSGAGGADAGPVTVTDDAGRKVTLDKPATRVVSLEWQQTEDLLVLGIDPVGAADVKGYNTWVTAAPLDAKTTDVGKRGEPNFDAVLSTNPDLIVLEASRGDDIITKLEKYDVPVLVTTGADTKDPVQKMKDTLNLIAEATGTQDKADQAISDFDAAVDKAAQSVKKSNPATTRFVYADAWVDGSNVAVRPFGKGSLVGELGEDVGLDNAWTGKVDEVYGLGQTDIEGITAVKDAHVVYTSTDSDLWLPTLSKNPLWKKADFVTNDTLHSFDEGVWTFGGPLSSAQVVEGFAAAVAGSGS